tara:strand:- start:482 stop:718 length:237 start_codon:yes stop_codon:yes gene_type:complete
LAQDNDERTKQKDIFLTKTNSVYLTTFNYGINYIYHFLFTLSQCDFLKKNKIKNGFKKIEKNQFLMPFLYKKIIGSRE